MANQHHVLKSHPPMFKELHGGRPFDVRKNDRDYKPGDTVTFGEWDPDTERFTGREITHEITHVSGLAQQVGFVVLGLKAPDKPIAPPA